MISYWFVIKFEFEEDTKSLCPKVMFSYKANFYVNGEVKKHNIHFWSTVTLTNQEQRADRITIRSVLRWKDWITGPYFFKGAINSENYLTVLGDKLLLDLDF